MKRDSSILFSLEQHPLTKVLSQGIGCSIGSLSQRQFPDGESYLRINDSVNQTHCIILLDLSHPNKKYLPLMFLSETLRELGAASVGLVAPYLSYMRQDRRFVNGEAVTSKIFAQDLSKHIDWLVTVDPHLHRYHSLEEIYSVPSVVIQGAPALAQWLKQQSDIFLVGPDSESEQWVAEIAAISGHDYVIGSKQRNGDRDVEVSLPNLVHLRDKSAVIIDDVISSGQTILQCIKTLQQQSVQHVRCVAIHGIFADHSDELLQSAGLQELTTSNSIPHESNRIDISPLLVEPIRQCLQALER